MNAEFLQLPGFVSGWARHLSAKSCGIRVALTAYLESGLGAQRQQSGDLGCSGSTAGDQPREETLAGADDLLPDSPTH